MFLSRSLVLYILNAAQYCLVFILECIDKTCELSGKLTEYDTVSTI